MRARCIAGPWGIGKTRLLIEARHRAQMAGWNVIEVQFLRKSSGEPALLEALRRLDRPDSAGWLRVLAVEHGGSTRQRVRRAVDLFLGDPAGRTGRLVDDLDNADPESRLFLEALVRECLERKRAGLSGRRLFLVVTASGEPQLGFSRPERRGIIRRLGPLAAAEGKAMLSALVRPLAVSPAAIGRLADISRGFPFRIRRIVRALHAEFGDRGCIPESVDLPPSLLAPIEESSVLPIDPSPDLSSVLLRSLVSSSPGAAIDHDLIRRGLPARRPVIGDDLVSGRTRRELHLEVDRAYFSSLYRSTGGDLGG